MTHEIQVRNSTLKTVKEKVDFIYEITSSEQGYQGSLHHNGSRFSKIVTILVKRGILIRTGHPQVPTYKWFNAATVPTKNLYLSIAQEMVNTERERVKKCYYKSKEEKKKEEPVVEQPEPSVDINANPLDDFSIAQLWDELRRRGCYIENGKLAQKTVQYFD